jgi:cation diffusion facilitator family transporter
VLTSLGLLGVAAVAQTVVFVLSGSVALLADLIHNFGDALTAVPLGIAFLLRSEQAERGAGLFVVAAIFISACVAGVEAIRRLIHESPPTHLWALAAAGAIGYLGNFVASKVRKSAGHRLDSPALLADGNHAAADAYVSLAVIASAIVVALGVSIADPLIGWPSPWPSCGSPGRAGTRSAETTTTTGRSSAASPSVELIESGHSPAARV